MTDTTTASAAGGTPNGQNTQPSGADGTATANTGTTPQADASSAGGSATAAGAVTPPADHQAAGEQPKPAEPAAKTLTLTQTELDAMIGDRLKRDREAQRKQFAAAFGIEDPAAGDGKQTPDQALVQAQTLIEQAQTRANTASARSFAQTAQVKAERVDTLVGMVDMKAALSGVDVNDLAKVDAAIKAAVEKKAAEFPEWKATSVPGASTANPNGAGGIPNIDERIAAATKAGDHATAISLKRAKARQQQSG